MSDLRKGFLQSIKESILLRVLFIGLLILILMIPQIMISSLINERKERKKEVIKEIGDKWSGAQNLTGPYIDIPVDVLRTNIIDKEKVTTIEKTYAHFLPEKLDIQFEIFPEILSRSIYKTVVYNADIILKSNFNESFTPDNITEENILKVYYDKAAINIGLSDLRGISKEVNLQWDKSDLIFEPGLNNQDICSTGIKAKVNLTQKNNKQIEFEIKLKIKGNEFLYFTPIGKETVVNGKSVWKTPSFTGYFLPVERNINEKGFTVKWDINQFNRNFPQKWISSNYKISDTNFGVELLTTIDEYQQINRTSKYAILFIILTFMAYFLIIEIFNRKPIHFIQYLMVGFTMSIFYLLILAMSEYLSFSYSYLIASSGVLLILGFYTKFISGSAKATILLDVLLVILYVFLYILTQKEDYSLLIGSIGLFLILALIMFFTRKIDWYNYKIK